MLSQVKKFVRARKKDINDAIVDRTRRAIERGSDYEILVLSGMRRSGNHLAISWILEQVEGSVAFYNNIRLDKHPHSGVMKEFRQRPGASPRILFSYEDATFDEILSGPLRPVLDDYAGRPGVGVRFGIVLRDPFNMFASRLKKWPERFATDAQIAQQIDLYLSQAQLARDPRPVWRDAPMIPLLYNQLTTDPAYRAELAGQLGIMPGDGGLDTVPTYGHGSSFDGSALSAGQIRDRVFSRWHDAKDDPIFRKLVDNAEVRAVAEETFGLTLD